MKTILILSSVIIFTSYLIFIKLRFGIQPSISQSYYMLKKKWLFSLAMSLSGLPILTLAFLNLPEFWFPEISLLLAGLSLMLVGVAPAFHYNKIEETLHNVFAFGAVGFGYSALMFYSIYYIPLIIISAIPCYYMMKRKAENYIWYSECIAFYTICFGLITLQL